QSEIDGLISLRAQQQQSLAVARAMGVSAIGRLEVIQQAVAGAVPVAPRPLVNGLLAALAGLAVAYGIVILRATMNTRLTDVAEVEAASGVPILAEFQGCRSPPAASPARPRATCAPGCCSPPATPRRA